MITRLENVMRVGTRILVLCKFLLFKKKIIILIKDDVSYFT
jgi:hypothetical protein